MHAEVERSLPNELDLLNDVIAASGKSQADAHAATTMPWNGISQE
jgi:hypothetical protein